MSERPEPPKLLDRIPQAARLPHLSGRTEDAYVAWARRFILFHGKRHPDQMGALQIVAFLSDLAVRGASPPPRRTRRSQRCASSTASSSAARSRESTARCARRARSACPSCSHATGTDGGGLRLLEALRLRVKDIDFDRSQLVLRDPKGGRDRVAPLPRVARAPLRRHLVQVHRLHETDLANGLSGAPLPGGLARKYPHAPREWAWQWVFPATRIGVDPATRQRFRHHLHETAVQRA